MKSVAEASELKSGCVSWAGLFHIEYLLFEALRSGEYYFPIAI